MPARPPVIDLSACFTMALVFDAAGYGNFPVGARGPTAPLGTNDTRFATTEFVNLVVGGAGDTFPVSPVVGQRFFRTDLGLDCYWNGTYWLTVQLYEMGVSGTDTLFPTAGSPITTARFAIRQDYQLWVEKIRVVTFVSTGNTGAVYWSLEASRRNAANTSVSLGTVTTQSDTNANWVSKTITINAALAVGTLQVQIVATKVGAPGTLYAPASLGYRLIVG